MLIVMESIGGTVPVIQSITIRTNPYIPNLIFAKRQNKIIAQAVLVIRNVAYGCKYIFPVVEYTDTAT
jgi:hypothetical protein